MSDIDTYLTQLRSHLTDLDPKRADEIIAEARTHLESRAAQLRVGGMDDIEANAEAARTFGDPSQVAQDLIRGNSRHRRPIALRVVAAIVITFGTSLALGLLVLGMVVLSREGETMLPANLATGAAGIVRLVGFCGLGLLTGIVGGRRFWWIAALPGCAMIAWVLLSLSLTSSTVRAESGLSVVTVVSALVPFAVFPALMLSLAWLGSRLPRPGRLSVSLTVIAGSVVGLIWLGAIMVLVTVSRLNQAKAGEVWDYVALAAIVMPVVLAFLIAGRRDRFLSRGAFISSVSGILGICLLLSALVAGARWDIGPAPGLLAIPILFCFTGLVAILIYIVRTGSTDATSLPPAESK